MKVLLNKANSQVIRETENASKQRFDHYIINGVTGIGKTHNTAPTLVKRGEKVLLCPFTNKNVERIGSELRTLGLNVQVITSLKHNLYKKYLITLKLSEKTDLYFDGSSPDKPHVLRTIKNKLNCSDTAAEEIYEECLPVAPDFKNHDVVIMTQMRFLTLKIEQLSASCIKLIIPSSVVVVFDDPSYLLLKNRILVNDNNAKYKNKKFYGQKYKTKMYENEQEFFVKPDILDLCKGLGNKFIWLTADTVKTRLIEGLYPKKKTKTVEIKPDFGNAGGFVDIIGSDITRSKRHYRLTPLIARTDRLMRDGGSLFMSNGLHQKENVILIEGTNDKTEKHCIEKLSQPNYTHLAEIAQQLEIPPSEASLMIMLDELHQMTGRARGARKVLSKSKKNYDFVVVVDHQYFQRIVDNCQHSIGKAINLKTHKEEIKKPKKKTRFDLLSWLIQNESKYFDGSLDGKRAFDQITKDMRSVFESTREPNIGKIANYYIEHIESLDGSDKNDFRLNMNVWLNANSAELKDVA